MFIPCRRLFPFAVKFATARLPTTTGVCPQAVIYRVWVSHTIFT